MVKKSARRTRSMNTSILKALMPKMRAIGVPVNDYCVEEFVDIPKFRYNKIPLQTVTKDKDGFSLRLDEKDHPEYFIARKYVSAPVSGGNTTNVFLGLVALYSAMRVDIQFKIILPEDQSSIAQQEITNIWEGTVQVNWKLANGVSHALDANPTTAECLGEVVREAVSNASRHGGANWIEIEINLEDSMVLVKAIDNGSVTNTGKTQGLGSELLNDVCSSWSLAANPTGGMTLRADLLIEA